MVTSNKRSLYATRTVVAEEAGLFRSITHWYNPPKIIPVCVASLGLKLNTPPRCLTWIWKVSFSVPLMLRSFPALCHPRPNT